MPNRIDKLMHRRCLRHWQQAARQAVRADLLTLRRKRDDARALEHELRRFFNVAEGRLRLPLRGTNAIERPIGTDWAWRPEIWRGPLAPPGIAAVVNGSSYGNEAKIFHDCPRSEIILRQIRNDDCEDVLAPFGLRLEAFAFEGSFLSLALDLPPESLEGLEKDHVFRATIDRMTERDIEIFVRLNITCGPNTEQLVCEIPPGAGEGVAEFDLAYSRINEKRVEKFWLDVIFENPEFNRIHLRDLTVVRRVRAAV